MLKDFLPPLPTPDPPSQDQPLLDPPIANPLLITAFLQRRDALRLAHPDTDQPEPLTPLQIEEALLHNHRQGARILRTLASAQRIADRLGLTQDLVAAIIGLQQCVSGLDHEATDLAARRRLDSLTAAQRQRARARDEAAWVALLAAQVRWQHEILAGQHYRAAQQRKAQREAERARKEAEKRARAAEREARAEWRRWQREQANLFTLDDNDDDDDDLDPDDHPRRAHKNRSTRCRNRAPAWSRISMLSRREQEAQQEAQAAARRRRWRQKQEHLAACDAERQAAQQAQAAARRQEEAAWYRQQVQARQDEEARREERTRYKAARRAHRATRRLDRPALSNADETDPPLDTPPRHVSRHTTPSSSHPRNPARQPRRPASKHRARAAARPSRGSRTSALPPLVSRRTERRIMHRTDATVTIASPAEHTPADIDAATLSLARETWPTLAPVPVWQTICTAAKIRLYTSRERFATLPGSASTMTPRFAQNARPPSPPLWFSPHSGRRACCTDASLSLSLSRKPDLASGTSPPSPQTQAPQEQE